MTKSEAIDYAVKQIPQIVPLEEEDVRNLCLQVLGTGDQVTQSMETISEKFLDFLGQSDMAFDFVIEFYRILSQEDKPAQEKPNKSASKTVTSPETKRDEHKSPAKKPTTKETPKVSTGYTLSEKLTGHKSKSNHSSNFKNNKTKKANSLKDIDNVIKILELEDTDPDLKRYICNCQGNRHPLFEAAPNCLSCGKLICSMEGMHMKSCSFCGEELISAKERSLILDMLKEEKENIDNGKKDNTSENMQAQKKKKKKEKIYMMSSSMGTNEFQKSDEQLMKMEKDIERERKRKMVLENENISNDPTGDSENTENEITDPELLAAQKRLDTLLHFQDTSAERTKIIDNASDFSMSDTNNIWGSTKERALMLKKQQRNMKKWEKEERERNGRKDKYVVSLNIGQNGKVTITEAAKEKTLTNNELSDMEDDELEAIISDEDELDELKEMRALKNDIYRDKKSKSSSLQQKVWDPEEHLKQFQEPLYMDLSNGDDKVSTPEQKIITKKFNKSKSRVQIASKGETSLEENILAAF